MPQYTNTASGAADLTDTVCKALRRAWQLGQTYWQQADSESFVQHKKSEKTLTAFVALLDDTRAALASAPTPACQHRIVDARNRAIQSGYMCKDCGAMFAAADHGEALASAPAQPAEQLGPVRELLGHLSDILPDAEFAKIDTATWNAVSAMVGPAQVSAVESNTAGAAIAAGAVYAELPMQFACSGVFPVYSADQMRAFADGTHALRTKSEASREFLERMLSAMEGVIDVADRKTAEFDALRSCVVDLTLMLFKPEALRASRGQAPAGVLEDAALLDFLIEHRAYVVSDETCCDGYWLHWARPDGTTWVQADEHATPRDAIRAAIAQQKAGE